MMKKCRKWCLLLLTALMLFSAVSVSAAALNKTKATVLIGKTYQLKLTGTSAKVTWSSANKGIATVSANGLVKAAKPGSVKITAKAGGKSYICTVTVPRPSLTVSKKTLLLGKSSTIGVVNRGSAKVTWSSSNKAAVSVSSIGVVKALKPGASKITAKTVGITLTCTVTVPKPSLKASALSLEIGGAYTIGVNNGGSAGVTWSSSNKTVANVTSKGRVTGNLPGSAVITAKIAGTSYTCNVTVKKPSLNISRLELREGSYYTMSLSNAGNASVTWRSANSSIASVSSQGTVRGLKAGTTTVTASAGGTSHSCKVVVKAKIVTTTSAASSSSGSVQSSDNTAITTSTFASASMAYSALSKGMSNATELTALRKMIYLIGTKDEHFPDGYLEGTRYTNANYYKWTGGMYRGGYGCAGFCFRLSDTAFAGTLARKVQISDISSPKQIKPGDIIRMDFDTHSVTALRMESDYVIVGEANYNSSIHWGRKIAFSEIKRTGNYIMTRYVDNETKNSAAYRAAVANVLKNRDSLPDLKG